jgi:hypothetical protein
VDLLLFCDKNGWLSLVSSDLQSLFNAVLGSGVNAAAQTYVSHISGMSNSASWLILNMVYFDLIRVS